MSAATETSALAKRYRRRYVRDRSIVVGGQAWRFEHLLGPCQPAR
jgi:hypothetical protein